MVPKPITYVQNPIQRPHEPRHFMVLKQLQHIAALRGRIAFDRSKVQVTEPTVVGSETC